MISHIIHYNQCLAVMRYSAILLLSPETSCVRDYNLFIHNPSNAAFPVLPQCNLGYFVQDSHVDMSARLRGSSGAV